MLHRAETFHFGKSKRDIAAPFQREEAVLNSAPLKESFKKDFIDYTNFNFVPLEDEKFVTFEKYVGPTPESNWVIPGKLLVGAYPASQDDGETFELITSILKLGITKFVCLQLEYRAQGVTEEMWRSGAALRPYFEDVKLVVQLKASIPELQGYDIVDESRLSFVHFPIKDCGITDDGRVLELAKMLVKAISEGEIIYLHCWGGHGRTGTLVCIMLHLMYGLTAHEAMARCQLVHDLRQCPVQVGSPQTQPQRDQVVRVVKKLISQANSLRRTVSDVNVVPPAENANIEEHSPRNPTAHAITMSLTQGHGHYPIGSTPTPISSSDAASSPPKAPSASAEVTALNDEDPWSVDMVQGYDDVDVDSDGDDNCEQPKNNVSFDADGSDINSLLSAIPDNAEKSLESDAVFESLIDENDDDAESIRAASVVDSAAVGTPNPPGTLQPSNSLGGVRSFRNHKENKTS